MEARPPSTSLLDAASPVSSPSYTVTDSAIRIGYDRRVTLETLHHVQLAMPEGGEEAARAFYHGVLRLPEVAKPAHLAIRGGVWFERAEIRVHLGVEKDFSPARKAHPAFLVSGLDRLIEALVRSGYTPSRDQPLEGFDRVYVHDPFGNRLELMEPSDSR